VLVPMGIFLTYKALRDSQLFSKEFYYRTGRSLRALKFSRRQKEQASVIS